MNKTYNNISVKDVDGTFTEYNLTECTEQDLLEIHKKVNVNYLKLKKCLSLKNPRFADKEKYAKAKKALHILKSQMHQIQLELSTRKPQKIEAYYKELYQEAKEFLTEDITKYIEEKVNKRFSYNDANYE